MKRSTKIRDHIPDDIRRASKVIGLAVWLDDADAWMNATAVIETRMAEHKRKALAFAVLSTLDEDAFNDVMGAVYGAPESVGVAA